MNVFATTHTQLENLAKSAARKIADVAKGNWVVDVVTNAEQLAKALV
jgi:hypothetical protein